MKFDFDEINDRSGTYSLKWDIKDGELPMWVADMDFKTAPCITSAIEQRAKHGIFFRQEKSVRQKIKYFADAKKN